MTNLNNETRELNDIELDAVTGGNTQECSSLPIREDGECSAGINAAVIAWNACMNIARGQ